MENDRENERKGNGIFLGIVGVATLIVAIIGASFAYFSAQAASAEGAVNLTAYEFNASLSMREVYQSDAKLIPVDPDGEVTAGTEPNNTNLAYAINIAKKCTDAQNYKICALYEITITNGGTTDLTLNGKIITNTNVAAERDDATPFENLTYRKVTKSGELYTIDDTPITLVQTENGETPIETITVNANSSVTTYAIIYLNENGDQSAEMGATYTGQIVYASANGTGNQLTGTFNIS